MSAVALVFLGLVIGAVGFLPLASAVVRAEGANEPDMRRGLAAVAVSFVFLMAVVALTWAVCSDGVLWVAAGFIVGFFALWGLLAFWLVSGRRIDGRR